MSTIIKPIKLWNKYSIIFYRKIAKIISYPVKHLISGYKIPDIKVIRYLGEQEEISLDYQRIGKDFYKALDKYEQSK